MSNVISRNFFKVKVTLYLIYRYSYQQRSTIFQEMQKRIQHWIQRAQQMSEEHQTELEMERERRKNDLHQQSEDHRATVETIR